MSRIKTKRKHNIINKIWDFWIDTPNLDWIISICLSITIIYYKLINYQQIQDHASFYSVLSSTAIGVLGLGSVAVTLVVTVPQSDNLRRVLTESGIELVKIMFKCLYDLVLAIFLLNILYFFDTLGIFEISIGVTIIGCCVTFLSAFRLLWILKRILLLLI
jgi:hypothetical protein